MKETGFCLDFFEILSKMTVFIILGWIWWENEIYAYTMLYSELCVVIKWRKVRSESQDLEPQKTDFMCVQVKIKSYYSQQLLWQMNQKACVKNV